MTDDQDIQEVLKLMSGPLPLLPSRSEGNTVILRGVATKRPMCLHRHLRDVRSDMGAHACSNGRRF